MKKLKVLIIIFLVLCLIPIGINFYVIYQGKSNIYKESDINKVYDYALVLGCKAKSDGTPSSMLKDRLDKSIKLYNDGVVKNILISGDHSKNYSETDAMYNYLISNNIPDNVIVKDEVGFSTSESMINFQKNYQDKSAIIVTQMYHLYRAVYIGEKLNLNVVGVSSENTLYRGFIYRELREIIARNKDFVLIGIR